MSNYKIQYNDGFLRLMQSLNATLIFSVYQAGKIVLLNTNEKDQLRLSPISYQKPMGIALKDEAMAIATMNELHIYYNSTALAEKTRINNRQFERLYFPRITYHCGPLDLHDICFAGEELWAVNTRFSCLCSFDYQYNFTPRWKPSFISEITPEDRCHLNGLALEKDKPAYVTALGLGDTKQSWRENINSGGVLISVEDNEICLSGLAMPHSPKLIGDFIYLLESAKGELVRINRKTWQKDTIVKINGLVRGLSIIDNTAFIGVSMVRKKSTTFSKLDDNVKAENASIYVIDLKSGMILGMLGFQSIVEEIYDIQVMENTRSAGVLGIYDDRHKQAVTTPENVYWKKAHPETKPSSN